MTDFIRSTGLLLVLLNPFLVIVYLIDVLEKLDQKQFTQCFVSWADSLRLWYFYVLQFLEMPFFQILFRQNLHLFRFLAGLFFC